MSFERNTLILFVFCVVSTMASPDVATFFPQINGNLTQVTWAHAVNNQSILTSTLNDTAILMIEADVVLGTITGTNTTEQIPIMGHTPSNTSDISLATFLATIDTFNANVTSSNSTNSTATRKGIKLDFKSIEVFNQSLSILSGYSQGSYPLWINADIIQGPINANTTPVAPQQFLEGARQFNNSVLSIGWTTEYGANTTGSYTTDQINSMLNVISQNNVTQNITFPVRAGLAAESLPQIRTLLSNVSSSTLTLWSTEGDNVNVTNLRTLIADIGVTKIYIDVPEDLSSQLDLHNLPSSARIAAPMFVASVLIGALAFLFR